MAKNFESILLHIVNKKFNNPEDYVRFKESIYSKRSFLEFLWSCFRIGGDSVELLNSFFHCLRKVESRVGTAFNIRKREVTYENRKQQTADPERHRGEVDIRECDIALEGLEF